MSKLTGNLYVVRKVNTVVDNWDGIRIEYENMRAYEDVYDAEQFVKENEKWAGGNEYTPARSGKEFFMSPVYGHYGKIKFDIDVIPIIYRS